MQIGFLYDATVLIIQAYGAILRDGVTWTVERFLSEFTTVSRFTLLIRPPSDQAGYLATKLP